MNKEILLDGALDNGYTILDKILLAKIKKKKSYGTTTLTRLLSGEFG